MCKWKVVVIPFIISTHKLDTLHAISSIKYTAIGKKVLSTSFKLFERCPAHPADHITCLITVIYSNHTSCLRSDAPMYL